MNTLAAAAGTAGMSWKLLAVLGCVFIALLFFGLLLTSTQSRDDPGTRLAAQLDRHYTGRHGAGAGASAAASADGRMATAAVSSVARLLGTSVERSLATRLDLAMISRSPAEWVVFGTAGSLVLIVFLTVLTGDLLIAVLIGSLAGWAAMRLILASRISSRRRAFADQLPDVLQIIAGSLQSGFSLPQAVDAVVRENTQPAAAEFSRALAEIRIGGELEAALDKVANRMDSMDLRWSVMAIRIQRSVGGNLVEVLRNTIALMRERSALRRHVRALSAEGRLSAYILIALPVSIGAWLFYSRPGYVAPLISTPLGLTMLIGGAILMVVGSIWIRNVVKVEF